MAIFAVEADPACSGFELAPAALFCHDCEYSLAGVSSRVIVCAWSFSNVQIRDRDLIRIVDCRCSGRSWRWSRCRCVILCFCRQLRLERLPLLIIGSVLQVPSFNAGAEFSGNVIVTDYSAGRDSVYFHEVSSQLGCIGKRSICEVPVVVVRVCHAAGLIAAADLDRYAVVVRSDSVELSALVSVCAAADGPAGVFLRIWIVLHDFLIVYDEVRSSSSFWVCKPGRCRSGRSFFACYSGCVMVYQVLVFSSAG